MLALNRTFLPPSLRNTVEERMEKKYEILSSGHGTAIGNERTEQQRLPTHKAQPVKSQSWIGEATGP